MTKYSISGAYVLHKIFHFRHFLKNVTELQAASTLSASYILFSKGISGNWREVYTKSDLKILKIASETFSLAKNIFLGFEVLTNKTYFEVGFLKNINVTESSASV